MTTGTLLKVADVAERLKIGRTKTYNLLRTKKIPTYNFDGCIRVCEEDLERYIAQCRSEDLEENIS